ncbi:MAG: hypothetical protein K2N88_08450 [Muribaculaceae bacterium]|nr:hypothetical protein [Muribaculaceae bacterium]
MAKLKKSDWLPGILLIYLFAMTLWFAPELIEKGEIVRLILVFVAELAVIIILRSFLRKQEEK